MLNQFNELVKKKKTGFQISLEIKRLLKKDVKYAHEATCDKLMNN